MKNFEQKMQNDVYSLDSGFMSMFGCNKLAYWSFEVLLSDLLKTMA
jgi:hypothetical protein